MQFSNKDRKTYSSVGAVACFLILTMTKKIDKNRNMASQKKYDLVTKSDSLVIMVKFILMHFCLSAIRLFLESAFVDVVAIVPRVNCGPI